MSQEQSTINMDGFLNALSNNRRRMTVTYLAEHRDNISLRTLADDLGVQEAAPDADEAELHNAKQAVYVALYQSHCPVLDKHGIVCFDEDDSLGQGGHVVEPGPHFDRAQATLEAATADASQSTFRETLKNVFRRSYGASDKLL